MSGVQGSPRRASDQGSLPENTYGIEPEESREGATSAGPAIERDEEPGGLGPVFPMSASGTPVVDFVSRTMARLSHRWAEVRPGAQPGNAFGTMDVRQSRMALPPLRAPPSGPAVSVPHTPGALSGGTPTMGRMDVPGEENITQGIQAIRQGSTPLLFESPRLSLAEIATGRSPVAQPAVLPNISTQRYIYPSRKLSPRLTPIATPQTPLSSYGYGSIDTLAADIKTLSQYVQEQEQQKTLLLDSRNVNIGGERRGLTAQHFVEDTLVAESVSVVTCIQDLTACIWRELPQVQLPPLAKVWLVEGATRSAHRQVEGYGVNMEEIESSEESMKLFLDCLATTLCNHIARTVNSMHENGLIAVNELREPVGETQQESAGHSRRSSVAREPIRQGNGDTLLQDRRSAGWQLSPRQAAVVTPSKSVSFAPPVSPST
jgi:hypothetical protein